MLPVAFLWFRTNIRLLQLLVIVLNSGTTAETKCVERLETDTNASVSQGLLPSHERCRLGRLIEVPFITESFALTHN